MKQARLVDDILRQIDLGQFKQAEQKCAALQIEFPQQANIAGLLAYLRLKAGRSNAARKTLNQALNMNPDDTRVLHLMARVASDDENHIATEQLLRRIIKLSPGKYLPLNECGKFLLGQGRSLEAIEMFKQAASADPRIFENFRLLGDTQAIMGKSAAALESYKQVLNIEPDDAYALAGLGHMLRIEGQKDEAVSAYEKCTALHPEFGFTWWYLASIKGYRITDENLQVMHEQITSKKLSAKFETPIHFALARAYESRGDFDAAWQAYEIGNRLKRQQVNYQPQRNKETHDAIIEQFNPELLNRRQSTANSQATPIFILGLPRSGSTLIEQIITSHSMVEGTGELPYIFMLSSSLGTQRGDGLVYPEVMKELSDTQIESLGKVYDYHTGSHRKLKLPYFTDKMPANFAHVGFINMILPNAKIIDARRHPMSTCVANYRQLYAQGKNQSYDLVEMAEYILEYSRVMDHWQAVLPGKVLSVQYENVVENLEEQVRTILEFCELPWEDACVDFHQNPRPVNTASSEQVREPIYTDAVDFWKHYESKLEPISKLLEPLMRV